MTELEILLNELEINKKLEDKVEVFFNAFLDFHNFLSKNDTEIKIYFSPNSLSVYSESLNDIKKYSLFLCDKIISLTEINNKPIYTREDIFKMFIS